MTTASTHGERDRIHHVVAACQYDRIAVRQRDFPVTLPFEGFAHVHAGRDRLLDLGCGTGHLLVAQQPGGNVVALMLALR